MKLKNKIIIFILAFSIISLIFIFYFEKEYSYKKIIIGDKTIFVEIADSQEKRTKGLSGRNSLPKNKGMLFLFDKPDFYGFWMKGMNFPLDFIWIKDNEVIELTKNVKPEDFQPPNLLIPKDRVNKVLEVNAGFIEEFNIKIGDKVVF